MTTLEDANGRELASFIFHYDSDQSESVQCEESDIQRLFTADPRVCITLMRSIVADMSGRPDARLLRDFEGSVEYRGRVYQYSYAFGPELSLSIRAPEAKSELANKRRDALRRYRSAGADERALLVSEFSGDVGSLSPRALEEVFQGLFASDHLLAYPSATRSRRIDTLLFSRDVLALGVDHVEAKTVEDLVARILEGNLANASDGRVLVPAIGALIALSQGVSRLQSMVLEQVVEFVSSLGAHHNRSKPAIAEVLPGALDDRASPTNNARVLETLGRIRRSVAAAGPVADLIDSQIRQRLSELSEPTVADGLRKAMSVRDGDSSADVGQPGDYRQRTPC